ncbi:hypothetical protein GCM10007414_12190 [Agarivorans gilvus]|uniref:Uncharacterized protein n=1 Tax=Agarivorans gilvus TaxID=680279 RepID=A0ABQ1HZR7_9ALTE|nr:hypothetical protein GCM10007414_12190 [Agarivorans gilvus]
MQGRKPYTSLSQTELPQTSIHSFKFKPTLIANQALQLSANPSKQLIKIKKIIIKLTKTN